MADDDGHPVKLYVYELSNGMARAMSQSLLGTQIDGIWHTSIVVVSVASSKPNATATRCCREAWNTTMDKAFSLEIQAKPHSAGHWKSSTLGTGAHYWVSTLQSTLPSRCT